MKNELWWKCEVKGCEDRADVYPIAMPARPNVAIEKMRVWLPDVIIPAPLCGPCSTIAGADEWIVESALKFVNEMNAHLSRPITAKDFVLRMRMLEHFFSPGGLIKLPAMTWRAKA